MGSKVAVIERWAQLGCAPCSSLLPLRVAWVEQVRERIKLCEVEGAVVSCGSTGGPELRSRRLLGKLSEAYLEAPLGQGLESGAAQPTVEEESDHRAPPMTEGGLALPQWREGGA